MKRWLSLLGFVRMARLGFDLSLEDLALLAIVIAHERGNPITETRLHKVITIIERELRLGIVNPKPHYFGPYIPELRDAIEALRKNGYIEIEERSGEFSGHGYQHTRICRATAEGMRRAEELIRALSKTSKGRMLITLLELWTPQRLDVVLYYVYTKYPDLTERSIIKNAARHQSPSSPAQAGATHP